MLTRPTIAVRRRIFFTASISILLTAPPLSAQTTSPSTEERLHSAPTTPSSSEIQTLALVRQFAVARAGDRALIAYIDAGDPRTRGSLRLASVRVRPDGAIERTGNDRTIAPLASTVAIAWNSTGGAIAYVVPRPHRGQLPNHRPHRHTETNTHEALHHTLGAVTLTAGDVMLQRTDSEGTPIGQPVRVFEENARAYRVALAPDRDGWLVAWTGALASDDEVQGTVRAAHVRSDGTARSFASETGFTGQVGETIRVVPAGNTRPTPVVVWTGERCVSNHDAPAHTNVTVVPDAHGTHVERPGPPIECTEPRIFATEVHPDGSTSDIVVGPAVRSDAFAIVSRPTNGESVLFAPRGDEHTTPMLALWPLPRGQTPTPTPSSILPAGQNPSLLPELSATEPAVIDAGWDGDALAGIVLSSTHDRVRLFRGMQSTEMFLQSLVPDPYPRVYEATFATAAGAEPWLFARTGTALAGPLLLIRHPSTAPSTTASTAANDERLRNHLLRARAARAAYTQVESIYLALSSRSDAASNPRLSGWVASLRRLRDRWANACEPLLERARWLVRHGMGNDVLDLARQQCEIPP